MKLLFVSDNGFSEKDGKFYYNAGNIIHYKVASTFFDNVTFYARRSKYEKSALEIDSSHNVVLNKKVNTLFSLIKFLFFGINELRGLVKSSDALFCFGINGFFASQLARKMGKIVIVYIGGCPYDIISNLDTPFKTLKANIVKKMIILMTKNADYVHYVDAYLVDRYPTNGKQLVCPSAKIVIDEKILESRLNRKIDDKKIKIGLIGYTHNKIKGIDVAIKALSLLDSNYVLEVVGRGNNGWLIELAKKVGVDDRVFFLGEINREELFNWFDNIDIYIQPSVTEGLPRATVEAMSRALPTVTTAVGGLKELTMESFIIKKGDYTDLSRKIESLVDNIRNVQIRNFNKAKEFDMNILDDKRNKFYSFIKKMYEKEEEV